jgi:hypothetical protein
MLGVEVTVEKVDLTDDDQIVVVCARGKSRQTIPILDACLNVNSIRPAMRREVPTACSRSPFALRFRQQTVFKGSRGLCL